MRISSLKTLLLLAVMTGACGGGTATKEISQPPIRTGGQLQSVPINYYDLSPSLSADGTKVVFVSGRDTTEEGAQLRVYRANWPAGEKPGKVERVTSEDMGLEEAAELSPDGSSVAVLVSNDGDFDVYVVPYAGGKMKKITSDGDVKKRLQFSPDGKLLAWIRIESREATGFIADAAGKKTQALDFKNIEDLFWIPTGEDASYSLGVRVAEDLTGESVIKSATFSTVEGAASATFSDLGSVYVGSDHYTEAGADLVMASRRVPSAEKLRIDHLGTYEETKPANIFRTTVEDLPILFSTTDGSMIELEEIPGDSSKSFNVLNDGLHFLARNSIRCKGEKNIDFAWSLASVNTQGSSLERRYPLLNESGKWEVTSDVCEAGQIDHLISFFDAASVGSPSDFRAVYVTRFSTFKDKQCRVKAGDPEIRLIETGANSAVYDLSQNPDPDMSDSKRGDKGPCP